ncbi:hypothetical protein [Brevundimonas subvibrioides]|uniref:hypothetical protein n=1 Tax=Brevundimonas subvibrioides TaxID=74313 RepID=UPI0022B435A1|nr:hypothetical protein [Brevundimonas subvibrioides]
MNRFILAGLSLAIAASPPQTMAQARLTPAAAMEEIVSIDARNWVWNRYDRGSMRDVQIDQTSPDGRVLVFYGNYTYNGGSGGWARARYVDGQFSCIEFWDYAGSCRALGQTPSQAVAAGLFTLAVVGVAGAAIAGSGSSGSAAQDRGYRPEDDPRNYNRPDNNRPAPSSPASAPARQTPIGGEGGLYGCASPPCW